MHDADPSTPIFRRLRLENWRNFTQVDVDLQSCQVIVELSARRNPNIVNSGRRMLHFVQSHWRPAVAEVSSDSLRSCRRRSRELGRNMS
jgi:hypothetical protein